MMNEGQQKRKAKGGRKPKEDRAIFRYSISLTEDENQKFRKLFEKSDMPVMAHFIKACIFQTTVQCQMKHLKATKSHNIYLLKFPHFLCPESWGAGRIS